MSQLKAPNGKPSNLTPEQYALVRTPQFKAWFGDWENDPKNSSKVVDENGEPMVVFRGSKSKNPNYIPHKHELSNGIYFSTKKDVAELYTKSFWQNWVGRIFECFLNIRNIESYDTLKLKSNIYQADFEFYNKLVIESKKNNFDGICWDNFIDVPDLQVIFPKEPEDYMAKTFIVFEPTQIKLADGSNTTFDGNNPDIRFAEGGTTTSKLKAPNGKPSNLTPKQWKLVRTPQFKAWFGDWENNSENASKVVDENGEPLVVYHGTLENFNVFRTYFDNGTYHGKGAYFTSSTKDLTTNYVTNKEDIYLECFLNLRNPLIVGKKSEATYFEKKDREIILQQLRYYKFPRVNYAYEKSYDSDILEKIVREEFRESKSGELLNSIYRELGFSGIIFLSPNKLKGHTAPLKTKHFVAFQPNQIKLADGSNTTFDGNKPDIRFAEGGKTKRYMKKIKRGGITYGKSHAEGGIPVKNQSTGDMLEVEGGEGIVNKRSMASKSKVKLNGKDMSICEAVSQLNQMEGGVQFSCEDVSDRQFIRAMAKGGELDRGTRTEQEHIQVLKDLYAKRITPKQASERIAKDHLKEDSRYYSKLAKMEGKMADGGEIEMGKTYLIGRPEVSRGGRFNRGRAFYKTIKIDENGNKIISQQNFPISGSAKNVNFGENYVKITQKEFDKMYSKREGKMADGGKTRKHAKTTLKEAVGFDINSIDISKL